MSVHYFGIRHHGPGSAKSLIAHLEQLNPDIILIEGPPEATEIIQILDNPDCKPPVAILGYCPDNPAQALFFPFAEFSPEWQALQFAVKHKKKVQFIDLPLANTLAFSPKEPSPNPLSNGEGEEEESSPPTLYKGDGEEERYYFDPMDYLAEIEGLESGEAWWEQMFETRKDSTDVFEAVSEVMTELRTAFPEKTNERDLIREAYMRKMIRAAQKEMFTEIAVVCGAWHVPALKENIKAKEDDQLLKGLAKIKIATTWIPWTYERLSFYSGYGAGIHSPGWYHHVWNYQDDLSIRWLTFVAHVFRNNGMDVSVAHVMEGVRLAETLAALRGLFRPGLTELMESVLSVMCMGDGVKLQIIDKELVVSNRIGQVPENIPKAPLQQDVEKTQKKLRLALEADGKSYELDLRKENDKERSQLFHRLNILEIPWARESYSSGTGTFKESWYVRWEPEFAIQLIEKNTYGNTVESAATAFIIQQAKEYSSVMNIANCLERVLPAELPESIPVLVQLLDQAAAATSDVSELMNTIPDLAKVSRYGNVRKTDTEMVEPIIAGILARICINLPAACHSIDEDSARKLTESIKAVSDSIDLLQNQDYKKDWIQTIHKICSLPGISAMIAGFALRLLRDSGELSQEEQVQRFYFAISKAQNPLEAASWLEGFLKGSGSILLLDEDLWSIVYEWVENCDSESFTELLPILRRTFSNFTAPERKKMGEKVKYGQSKSKSNVLIQENINHVEAEKSIALVLKLLGKD